MTTDRGERGQAIVLIVLAIVAMFGFVGLAVDGGRVYSEQRRAQNAADAAAYAAAMAAVEGQDPYKAALKQATQNEFCDSDEGINDDLPVDVIVNHPPKEGQYIGNDGYYEVIVRTAVQGSFSRIIMMDQLPVQAYAVVHASDETAGLGDNAIHSLDRDGIGIEFKGSVDVEVQGGNIMSNSEIDKRGSSGEILVEGGGVYYVDGSADGWLGSVSPAPEKVDHPVLVPDVPMPDCGTVYWDGPNVVNGRQVYSPGIYNAMIEIRAHDDVLFKPGMFCLMQGIHDNGNSRTVARGVMFVILGGNLHFNGNSDIHLTRPNDLVDPSGNQWGGMLVYVPEDNAGAEVEITGNDGTSFSGTIFAPKGLCRIGGSAEVMGVNANIICNKILFHGNPNILINYKASQNFHLPPMIELTE